MPFYFAQNVLIGVKSCKAIVKQDFKKEGSTLDQEEQNVQETSQEKTSEQQEKMFTQSEVDRIVTDRVKRSKDKLRSELFEEAKSKVKAKQDEAKRLEEMNATQRRKYENQKRDEELEQLRAKVQRQEMEQTAMEILKEKGISVDQDVLDLMVADTAEKTSERIDKFAELVESKAREIRRQDMLDPQVLGLSEY